MTDRRNLFDAPLAQGTGEVYEPWKPEIGDRVAYHISNECVCPGCLELTHVITDWENTIGAGVITEIESCDIKRYCHNCGEHDVAKGHRFYIKSDNGVVNGYAAAIELEPIEPVAERAE